MGKKKSGKKGSKKKGSKKKGSKKKVSVTDDTIAPTNERIIQHQLDGRVELMKQSRKQRDELLLDCKELRQDLREIEEAKKDVISRINEYGDSVNTSIQNATEECQRKLQDIKKALEALKQENEAEVVSLRGKLEACEAELEDRTQYLQGLEYHKDVQKDEWATKINTLEAKLKKIKSDFSDDTQFLERQFHNMKLHFQDATCAKIDSAKFMASEAAINVQPVMDKIEYKDNGWLLLEYAHQEKEYNRLLQSCADLSEANGKLFDQAFGDTSSTDSSSHRPRSAHRPSSRQGVVSLMRHTSAPLLRMHLDAPLTNSDSATTTSRGRGLVLPGTPFPRVEIPLDETKALKIFSKHAVSGAGLTILGDDSNGRRTRRAQAVPSRQTGTWRPQTRAQTTLPGIRTRGMRSTSTRRPDTYNGSSLSGNRRRGSTHTTSTLYATS